MSLGASSNQQNEQTDLKRAVRRRLMQICAQYALVAVILFASAGQLDWPMAWAFLCVNVGILAINAAVLLPRNPELIAERGQMKKDAKAWDKWLAVPMTLFLLAVLVVAGLDRRFGWTPELGLPVQIAALALVGLSQGLFTWAMTSNKFFSSVVRIQKERGHTVVSSGPYRYIRHPGYAGSIVTLLTMPPAVGSLYALIPAGLAILSFVVRTVLEDRTLQAELDGYQEYVERVRYRLVPGVW